MVYRLANSLDFLLHRHPAARLPRAGAAQTCNTLYAWANASCSAPMAITRTRRPFFRMATRSEPCATPFGPPSMGGTFGSAGRSGRMKAEKHSTSILIPRNLSVL